MKKRRNIPENPEINRIRAKRDSIVMDQMHKASHYLIDYCLKNKIGKITIGYNSGWKQNLKIGKANTQNFSFIPLGKMVELVEYKAKLVGIKVIRISESYTSKASALDFDPIPDYKPAKKGTHTFSGTRGPSMKASTKKATPRSYRARGLYKTKKGLYIHSDINAAFNIGRKQFSDAFGKKNITQKQMLLSPLKVKV